MLRRWCLGYGIGYDPWQRFWSVAARPWTPCFCSGRLIDRHERKGLRAGKASPRSRGLPAHVSPGPLDHLAAGPAPSHGEANRYQAGSPAPSRAEGWLPGPLRGTPGPDTSRPVSPSCPGWNDLRLACIFDQPQLYFTIGYILTERPFCGRMCPQRTTKTTLRSVTWSKKTCQEIAVGGRGKRRWSGWLRCISKASPSRP